MPIGTPTTEEVRKLAEDFNLELSENEINQYQTLLAGTLEAYKTVDKYDEPPRYQPKYPRKPMGDHKKKNDTHNTWITCCHVNGADDGRLTGMDVAIKDNIPVAGIEMTCGSAVVDGYVPTIDSPVVRRLLDEGSTIIGKTNMDDMASTADGSRSEFGPVLNPHDTSHLAGGSSGGSAVAVATGEADVGIGTDQGGSVRAPASWCGVVGLKPTHGLVPYTGAIGLEPTVDHIGPLAQDVETTASVLSTIAGADEGDPRQLDTVPEIEYEQTLEGTSDELSIGVVSEGFDQPNASTTVNDRVRVVLDDLADAGATVEDVSLPEHSDGQDIHIASLAEAVVATLRGEGYGHGHAGWYDTDWIKSFGASRRVRGGEFPVGLKLTLLLGAYANDVSHSQYHGKAMNLRWQLANAYDEALEEFDLLAMPTTPMQAFEHDPELGLIEHAEQAFTNLANTAPFNATGHPSVSIPVPVSADDLPVGLMLTGNRFDDETVLDGAYAAQKVAKL